MGLVVVALAHGSYGLSAYGTATLAVWWTLVVGLALGSWPLDFVPRYAVAAGACLMGFALFAGLSVIWAGDAGRALDEAIRAAGYAGLFALVVATSARGSARSWLIGLTIGLVAIAALATLSRMLPSLFGEPATAEFLRSARSRLSYPVGYWNALGAIMALTVTLLAWLSTEAVSRPGRAAAAAALPIPLLALFLTSSRGGVLGVLAGLAILVAATPRRDRLLASFLPGLLGGVAVIAFSLPRNAFLDAERGAAGTSQGRAVLVATVLVVLATGAARYLLDGRLSRIRVPARTQRIAAAGVALALVVVVVASDPVAKLDSFRDASSLKSGAQAGLVKRHLTSSDGTGRYQFWKAAWQGFEAHPVAGVGAGGYEAWWAQHGSISYYIRNAHSLPLEVLAELGLVGFLLLAGGFGVAVTAGVRRRAGDPSTAAAALALVGAGLASAAIDWTWQIPAAFGPVVVGAALLAGPALGLGQRIRAPFGWGLATIMAGWVAIATTALVLAGDAGLSASRDATSRGDLDQAARAARRAEALEPWSSRPKLQLALVNELDGGLTGARREIDQAIDHAPDDWRLWVVAARIRSKSGDLQGARAALKRARELNPRSPLLSAAGA